MKQKYDFDRTFALSRGLAGQAVEVGESSTSRPEKGRYSRRFLEVDCCEALDFVAAGGFNIIGVVSDNISTDNEEHVPGTGMAELVDIASVTNVPWTGRADLVDIASDKHVDEGSKIGIEVFISDKT